MNEIDLTQLEEAPILQILEDLIEVTESLTRTNCSLTDHHKGKHHDKLGAAKAQLAKVRAQNQVWLDQLKKMTSDEVAVLPADEPEAIFTQVSPPSPTILTPNPTGVQA